MSSRIYWTQQACKDLRAIRNHIVRDAPISATAYVRQLRSDRFKDAVNDRLPSCTIGWLIGKEPIVDTELCDASSAEAAQFKQSGGTNQQFDCLAASEKERDELVDRRLPSSQRSGMCSVEQSRKRMAY